MLDMEIKSLGGAIVDCVSAAATHLVCASGFDKDRSQSRVARRVFTYESWCLSIGMQLHLCVVCLETDMSLCLPLGGAWRLLDAEAMEQVRLALDVHPSVACVGEAFLEER